MDSGKSELDLVRDILRDGGLDAVGRRQRRVFALERLILARARRDAEVLQRIADTLDGREWDADTSAQIAEIMRAAGYGVKGGAR